MHTKLTNACGNWLMTVCRALSGGAAALFGPMSLASSAHLRSLCATINLPHIEARRDDDEPVSRPSSDNFTVNVFPRHSALDRALVDCVRHLQWTSLALLYISDDGIHRRHDALRSSGRFVKMGTLADQAEIVVSGSKHRERFYEGPRKICWYCTCKILQFWCTFGRKMVRNAVHNAPTANSCAFVLKHF